LRKWLILVLVVVLFISTLPSTADSTTGTNVQGRLLYNTDWTAAGSPYNLTGDVTVIGSLSIGPGTVINGNGYRINAMVSANGTSDNKIIFNNVKVQRGSYYGTDGTYTTVGNGKLLVRLKFCEFNNSSVLNSSTSGIVDITDSSFKNSSIFDSTTFISDYTNPSHIERNEFINSTGMKLNFNDSSVTLYLKNNLIYDSFSEIWLSPNNHSKIHIENNSFINTNKYILNLYNNSTGLTLSLKENYWNTSDMNVIKSMIKNLPQNIELGPILLEPHELTPKLQGVVVLSTEPVNNSIDVLASAPKIKVSFTENMKIDSEFNRIRLHKGNQNVEVTAEVMNQDLIIIPNQRLDYESEYTVEVPIGALQNEAGVPSEGRRFTFTTKPQMIKANPVGGLYNEIKEISLTGIEANTTIFYTTDGTNPIEYGSVYTTPIIVDRDKQLQFVGENEHDQWTEIYSENYLIDLIPPLSPIVNSIGDSDTVITGEAEVDAEILISADGQLVGTTFVDSNGYFTASISPIKAGTEVSIKVRDKAGNISETITTVLDKTPPNKPVVHLINDQSNVIRGRADIGSTVLIKNGDLLLAEVQVNEQGEFLAMITQLPGGTILDIISVDTAGNTSPNESVYVSSTMAYKSNVVMIDGGSYHTLALKSDGSVWSWGYNYQGQIGDSTNVDKNRPVDTKLGYISEISTGYLHSVALEKDGDVWTWGSNSYGQLGDGSTINRSSPYKIEGLENIISIAAGKFHTIALESDGTVWQWGWDTVNQTYHNPVAISGLNDIKQISASGNHSIALKNDGTVVTWGYNNSGQLGNGSFTNSASPVYVTYLNPATNKIEVLKNIKEVDAGDWHSIALTSDGNVYVWGYNGYGVLGIGSSSNANRATKVNSLNKVIDIDAGFEHSVALKNDGTVWAWGDNRYGQLGDGTVYRRTYPVKAVGLSNIVSISTGSGFTMALDQRGTPWIWGENKYGALGIGSNIQNNSPVKVDGIFPEINEATALIESIPPSISYGDKGTIILARQKVNAAIDKGALDREIPNLSKLIEAEQSIQGIENTYKADVEADKNALEIGYSDGDTIDHVTRDVVLPIIGENGTNISWNSSHLDVITENGSVIRPKYDSGDRVVELKATLFKGDIQDTKHFQFIVKELPKETQPPIVNLIHDQTTEVTGTAETGVIITVMVGEVILGSTATAEDGSFALSIAPQKAGTKLSVVAIDSLGNKSQPTIVVVADITAPSAPIVHPVNNESLEITGTADSATSIVVKVGEKVIGTDETLEDGSFVVSIERQLAGTTLSIAATDFAGNISISTFVLVADVTPPSAPVVDIVYDKSIEITGTAEEKSTVTVQSAEHILGIATVNEDGRFIIPISKFEAGTVLSITATDLAGNISETYIITVEEWLPTIVSLAVNKNQVVAGENITFTAQLSGVQKIYLQYDFPVKHYMDGGYTSGAFGMSLIYDSLSNTWRTTKSVPSEGGIYHLTYISLTDDEGNNYTIDSRGMHLLNDGRVIKEYPDISLPTSSIMVDDLKHPVITGSYPTQSIPVDRTAYLYFSEGIYKGEHFSNITLKDTSGTPVSITTEIKSGTLFIKPNVRLVNNDMYQLYIPANAIVDGYGNNLASDYTYDLKAIPPQAPTVNEVTDQSTFVMGTAEVGSTVYVKNGDTTLGSSIVMQDGTFEVSISPQMGGTVLSVVSKDKLGNISQPTTVVVQLTESDITAPDAPIVNVVTDQSIEVTGMAEADSIVSVESGALIIGTGVAGKDGHFAVEIYQLTAGTVIFVRSTDRSGNVSEATDVTVTDVTAPLVPLVNEVNDQSSNVTGTAEAGSTITVRLGESTLGTTVVQEEGKYSISIEKQIAGTNLLITATDIACNESDVVIVKVLDVTAPAAPVVDDVNDQSIVVIGTAEAGTVVIVMDGQRTLGSGLTRVDGTFSVSIETPKAGTTLLVTSKDTSGNESVAASVLVSDVTPPPAPIVNEVNDQSLVILGIADVGSTVIVSVGEKVIGSVVIEEDGTYKFEIEPLAAGTILSVTASDRIGNVSEATVIVVADVTAPKAPVVNEVNDQMVEVKGTAEAGSNVVVKLGEMIIGTGITQSDGTFLVGIERQKADTILTLTVIDPAGNVSEATEIIVLDITAPVAPILNRITDQSLAVAGTAEIGSTVMVSSGDNVLGSVVTDAEGNFSISLSNLLDAGTILSVTATDQAGNVSESTMITVVDTTPPAAPIVNVITDQTIKVTGTAEIDTTVNVKVGDTVIGSAKTLADGTFTIFIEKQVGGSNLSVTSADAAGNVSEVTSVVVEDVTPPNIPIVDIVNNRSEEVTGTAEAGSTVIIESEGMILGEGIAAENGGFTIVIPKQVKGTILSVTATDGSGNASETNFLTVQIWLPAIQSLTVDRDQLTAGENIVFTAKLSGIEQIYLQYDFPVKQYLDGGYSSGAMGIFLTYDSSSNTWKTTKSVPTEGGTYTLTYISLTDDEGNTYTIDKRGIHLLKEGKILETYPSVTLPISNFTVNDLKAPNVAGLYPPQQWNVDKTNYIYFSEGIKKGTNFEQIIVMDKNGEPTSITVEIHSGTLSITPNTRLVSGELYTLNIPASAITDEYGNEMLNDYSVEFKTKGVLMPNVNIVTNQSTQVTGTAEVGTIVLVKTGEKVLGTGKTQEDGTFTVMIEAQVAGTILSVLAMDSLGNESEVTSLKVLDATPPNAPIVNDVSEQSYEVSGFAEAGTTVTVLVGETVLGSSIADVDGTFRVFIEPRRSGTILSVIATDLSGNMSPVTEVTIIGNEVTLPIAPTVNAVHDQSVGVTGTAEPGTTIRIMANGIEIGSDVVQEDGGFSVAIELQLEGTVLSITATDSFGNVSEATLITVISSDSISSISFDAGDYQLATNGKARFTVIATSYIGKTHDITELVTITISDTVIFTLIKNGLLQGVSEGYAVIGAEFGGMVSRAKVQVMKEIIPVKKREDGPTGKDGKTNLDVVSQYVNNRETDLEIDNTDI
jgi:alpha-tubulin suppressor-like RCC1 family protein